jgi:hypothetical protein
VGQVIGTLPAGYRPSKRYIFATEGVIAPASEANQADARIDITTSGQIIFYASGLSNGWISLEGIHFYQEN